MLQLLGDEVPQTPYRGFAPRPHWGTSVPQVPFASSVLEVWLRPASKRARKRVFWQSSCVSVSATISTARTRHAREHCVTIYKTTQQQKSWLLQGFRVLISIASLIECLRIRTNLAHTIFRTFSNCI
jgi:hypothetical protein